MSETGIISIKKYNAILLFALICFCNSYSQSDWLPAHVILTDSSSFRGYVKLKPESIKYKKKKKSKTVRFESQDIHEIIYGDVLYSAIFIRYIPLRPNRRVAMQLIEEGTVSVYQRVNFDILSGVFSSMPGNNFNSLGEAPSVNTDVFGNNQQKTFDSFGDSPSGFSGKDIYLFRNEDERSELIIGTYSSGRFIDRALDYFSDCEEIISYLKEGLYQEKDIIQLVRDYNLLCN